MLQLNQISKSVFGNLLFRNAEAQMNKGEKIALVGDNGAGKSTLLKIIAGIEGVDGGHISISKGQQVSYLEQNSLIGGLESVYDYIFNGQKEIKELQNQLTTLETQMSIVENEDLEHLMVKYGKLQEIFLEKDGYSIEESIKSIAMGLKIYPLLNEPISTLSGGQQTLAKLSRCLLENKDILLLDEPTNHLDTVGLNWLENYLKHSQQMVIIVSHDRYFLDQVANSVWLIDQNELRSYKGNYTQFKKKRNKELDELQKNYLIQEKEIKQVEDAIRRFRHWGAISDNEKHFKKAKRLEKQIETMSKIELPTKKKQVSEKQGFTHQEKSGKEVVSIASISKYYGNELIFSDLSLDIYKGDRLAIIGDNGTGKSTLLKCILGKESIDSGEIKIGPSVEIGYLSQVIAYDIENQTVLDYFKEKISVVEEDARRILSYFHFSKESVFKQVGKLSGGEKVRLEIACLMNQPINCLILDEPTNHLDILTREWLEEQLITFKGTLVMVSHDRYFVEKISTKRYKIN